MPASRRTPWIICYDIADPRRLHKVHRIVSRNAESFQYSVFRKNATRNKVLAVLQEIEQSIEHRWDDVRAYPLLTTAPPMFYGRRLLPEGVSLADHPDPFFNSSQAADRATLVARQLGARGRSDHARSKLVEIK